MESEGRVTHKVTTGEVIPTGSRIQFTRFWGNWQGSYSRYEKFKISERGGETVKLKFTNGKVGRDNNWIYLGETIWGENTGWGGNSLCMNLSMMILWSSGHQNHHYQEEAIASFGYWSDS